MSHPHSPWHEPNDSIDRPLDPVRDPLPERRRSERFAPGLRGPVRRRVAVAAFALVPALALSFASCGREETDDIAHDASEATRVQPHSDAPAPTDPTRITLSRDQLEAAGIRLAQAGPARIRTKLPFGGRIVENAERLAHVAPRFPGLVRSVEKRLGDRVAKGDLLAVVESNQSLHPYEIRAGLSGVVLARDVAPGEYVAPERPIFTIGDLSTVWVELDVHRRDFGQLARGQRVFVDGEDGREPAASTLAYLAPFGSENTQTLVARAALENHDERWRPGQFVSAEIQIAELDARVAVPLAAIQRMNEREVVFFAQQSTDAEHIVFEPREVETGPADAESVAIEAGLEPGASIAVEGSFVLKAEASKSRAQHEASE